MRTLQQFIETKKAVDKLIFDLQAMVSLKGLPEGMLKKLLNIEKNLNHFVDEMAHSLNTQGTYKIGRTLESLIADFTITMFECIGYLDSTEYQKFSSMLTV
jgi:hypothetical protein